MFSFGCKDGECTLPGRRTYESKAKEGELVRAQHSGCWLSLTASPISKRLTKQISTHVNRIVLRCQPKKSDCIVSDSHATGRTSSRALAIQRGPFCSLEVLTILEMSMQHSSSLNSRLHKRVHSHFLTRMFFSQLLLEFCVLGVSPVAPGSGRGGGGGHAVRQRENGRRACHLRTTELGVTTGARRLG
jgi:hypothetical protein